MSAVNEILTHVPMQQLAAELGTDEQTARAAAETAAAQLLGGLAGNAQNSDVEVSLASALSDHARSNHLLDTGTVDLGSVDQGEADKILGHVFADPQVAALSGAQQAAGSGVSQDMMMKVLKFLAPVVLAYLAKNLQGGKYGDILGSVLGGGSQGQSSGGGGILGQILGQVLGGGAAGGLGGALGGALGGGSSAADEPVVTDRSPSTPSGGFEPTGPSAGGGLQMDDGADDTSASPAPPQPAPQQGRPGTGGVFGDILGKIFGR